MIKYFASQKTGNMTKPEYLFKQYIYVVLILNLDAYTDFIN